MARIGNKGPQLETSSAAGRWLLERVSKAALMELYLAALARANGAADEAPTKEQVCEDADPVLRIRGDRALAKMLQKERS